ncbi:putative N-acetylglucosaminyl-phosphatidylinositol de-N-acetylase [Cytospora mali]|uniref:N-acetylglucosaminylphosphatidylinositol deacetylase n=1 Tax=Cytospora mali TaxID=578113 RepID=A0A194VL62_CYTMA|nr:putative N-acetylglucosaminyl-phosphatidylinositol de-N-acetylase [Valsa mali]
MNLSPLVLALLAILVPSLYLYTVAVVSMRLPTLRNKRICLLIAHPDDEAMFFAPTVLALARPEMGNHVKILCLSSGNAEGLGDTRKRELVKSGLVLGLRKDEDVFVVDRPDEFPDSMATTWSTDSISQLLRSAFAPTLTTSNPPDDKEPPKATIDVLITFDAHGISSHPNHISLYHGARAFISSLTAGKPGWSSPVDMYTLTSVNIMRKYTGVLDVFATLGVAALDAWKGPDAKSVRTKDPTKHPAALVYMHGFGAGGWATAREAMTRAHISQMVWFRWGWITVSRYMFMNDIRLERV